MFACTVDVHFLANFTSNWSKLIRLCSFWIKKDMRKLSKIFLKKRYEEIKQNLSKKIYEEILQFFYLLCPLHFGIAVLE